MKHRKLFIRFLAAIMAFALIGAACGGDSGSPAGDATQSESEDSTDTGSEDTGGETEVALTEGAPALNQALTDLLDSHVYMASIAVAVGLNSGLDSPEFGAAAEALDTNSQDLASAIESVYGPEAGEAFLKQWREHIGFFVDYTAGKATGDKKAADKALKNLDNYRADFAAFIDSATEGELPADATADALQMHVKSLTAAIDAAIAGDVSVYDKIYEAASGHMPMTATALSGAIAAQSPDKFPGSVDSPDAALQQGLTDLLDSHVYLASIAVYTGLTAGLDSKNFEAAAGTLDQNSQDIAAAIESVYGPEGGEAFLKLWREHIGFFVDYTAGKATGDKKAANAALKKLDNYRADFAAFMESATEGELPADATADALDMHVKSLTAAIDAAVAGDASVFAKIYEAAHNHMPMTATAFAQAITAQFPDKF